MCLTNIYIFLQTIEMKNLLSDADPVVLIAATDQFPMDPVSLTYFNGQIYWIDK